MTKHDEEDNDGEGDGQQLGAYCVPGTLKNIRKCHCFSLSMQL